MIMQKKQKEEAKERKGKRKCGEKAEERGR